MTTTARPYLIQRLTWREEPDNRYKGRLAHNFEIEWMGAAEFEFGTIGSQMDLMARADFEKPIADKIFLPRESKSVEELWYVGMSDQRREAEDLIEDQLKKEPTYRFCELPYLRERLGVEVGARQRTTNGWWAYAKQSRGGADGPGMKVPWALFLEEEHARCFLGHVESYREGMKKG